MASTEVERAGGVDIADVPSANWGWSNINHRNWRVAGLLIFGLLALFFLVRDWWGRRRGWLR